MEENMEMNEKEDISTEEMNAQVLNQDAYVPRPAWQKIAAWIGIGIVAVGFVLYCCHIAGIL